MVNMRRVNLVVFAALVAFGSATGICAPAHQSAAGSVSGVVRDSAGVPQIGAVVQLLRPDLTLLAVAYTNSDGWFTIPSVLPGKYTIKAMGTSFLPSLRENVRVRTTTVVNLTLNTLYEAMQWLPSQPRGANAQPDDWKWTLRSAANRPLLRWLEDCPLVVVADGAGKAPRLKARLMATGQQGTFGESGERLSAAVEETPSNSRELLARVDFAPDSNAGLESMLGFRQDLGFAGAVQSVAAVSIHPEVDGGGSEGVDEAAMRTWETLNLGDELEAEVGSTQLLARASGNSVLTALPMVSVGYREGNSTVRYRLATALPSRPETGETEAQAWLPELSVRNGQLAIERGLHQEIGWERRSDTSGMSVVVFADLLDNPVLEAITRFAAGGSTAAISPAVLFDPSSGLMRAAGPDFSTAGVVATVEKRMPGGNVIRVSYANGDALVMTSSSSQIPVQIPVQPVNLAQVLSLVHPRRAQMYSLSVSGTLDGTGTRWRASYRWQPEDTVTPVAAYAANAVEPYLNLHLRQPIHKCRDGASSLEALLDVRNLLAQGYRPYLMSDGSLLVFAQDQRGFQGGLAFTF